jgi:tol-pal system protein YbgF
MTFRSITGGALFLLMLSGTAAMASDGAMSPRSGAHAAAPSRSSGLPRVFTGLRGVFEVNRRAAPVLVAQAVDPRVTELEEEIRKLSGTIEELNFQVLQMQEQLRKMQEDNEFRFQELEGGKGQAGAGTNKKSDATTDPAKDKAASDSTAPATGDAAAQTAPDGGNADAAAADPQNPAAPQVDLGTITVDKDGNISGGTVGKPVDLLDGAGKPSDNTTVAALPATDDPEELYRNSYEFILSGDYGTAEAGFRDHINRFPADPKAADAHYWLGESLLGQQKFRDAAEVFLAANHDYPDSGKAPDMLLKLGISLNGLKQHEVACATYTEIGKRYPGASDALKKRVKQEEALAAC